MKHNFDNKKLGIWVENSGAQVDGSKHLQNNFDIWHYKENRKYLKVIGKCVNQVYFVEKWSKWQELKFSIS